MSISSTGRIVDRLCRRVGAAAFADLSDGELLEQFLAGHKPNTEAAFAVLVQRHGPLVYRVCRSALRDSHDADDAFQATFMVLARKAGTLRRRGSLAPWLIEVARRVSAHARAASARRARHERNAACPEEQLAGKQSADHAATVHEALGQLPERMRTPIVLCDLEGLSYQETAERLGWSLGAVRNQLSRARQRLRTVLQRMGLDPAAASVAWHALPPMPRELATATSIAGAPMASGLTAAAMSASVLTLTNQGIQSMMLLKLKSLGLSLTSAAVLVAGAYGLSGQTPGDKAAPANAAKSETAPDAAPTAQTATAKLIAKFTKPGVNIEKPIDDAPLKDILEFLSDKYQVSFVVDATGFDREIGNKNVEDTQVRLPRMTNVDLNTILRHLLAQVGGAVLVRENHLEIVPAERAFQEAHGAVPPDLIPLRRLQPLVSLAYTNMQLPNVLTDIARQSGRNIVLDPRVKDHDKLVVTATMLNVPVDTAVRVLAEMTGLRCVLMDSVFFVTSLEHAANLQEEEARVHEQRLGRIRVPKLEPKAAASAKP